MENPLSDYDNLPLCDHESTLRCKVAAYHNIKESRLQKLAELKSKEEHVCNALGIHPHGDFPNPVPSAQLDEFEVYIDDKSDENDRLTQVYRRLKSELSGIMTELKIVPTLDFEKLVMCDEDAAFKHHIGNHIKSKQQILRYKM
jgi:hypothetical protein